MSRPLLVLRPEPGNAQTCRRASAAGIEAIGVPLFAIAPVAWSAEPPESYAGLLLTSANAVRHAGALGALLALPVYAVGSATAAAARAAGFGSVVEGEDDVERLIAKVATLGKHRLLHLSGRDATPFDAHGIAIDRRVVYEADAIADPPGLVEALALKPVALLHSARAAGRFAGLCQSKQGIAIVAISDAVADAAGLGWEEVAVSPQPRDDAMLEIAARVCRGNERDEQWSQ